MGMSAIWYLWFFSQDKHQSTTPKNIDKKINIALYFIQAALDESQYFKNFQQAFAHVSNESWVKH